MLCPGCGEENPDRFRLCGYCGTALKQPASAEVRKIVTLVFPDVTGSTALGERLDPESVRWVMQNFFETAELVLERYGGSVEKFIGDAVMAAFGIPVVIVAAWITRGQPWLLDDNSHDPVRCQS